MADTYQSKYTGAEIDKRLEWAEEISPHIAKQLNTEFGIHGIRYWQEKLEYNDGESWVEIETGSGSVTTKTETQWATENPILELGEIGIAIDTNRIKIGNGTSRWNSLPYMTQGDKGDPGEKGEKGDKGDPGEKGEKGDKGEPGEKGEKGDKGDKGEQGPKGDKGDSIEFAWNGTQLGVRVEGETSYQYVDLKGEKGDKGDKGDTGEQGIQGPKGDKGDTGPKGDKPAHRWVTTSLQFENPDGTWGDAVNLKGESGEGSGDMHTSIYDTTGKNTDIFNYVDTGLSGKVDNARVLTDVPLNAKFTDTVYTHPANHAPSIITQDANNRFVTDAEKSIWNSKADGVHAHDDRYYTEAEVNALLDGKVDNSRVLTDVPAGAKFTDTVYTHPATHSADIIVDGTTNKAYTATEKSKLAGIETGANKTTIVNNLTETEPGKALDATQGKALADLISNLSLEVDGKAVKYSATGTLTVAGWTGTTAPYSQAITVEGILADDEPNYDVVLSGTYETDVAREADWANVYRLVTSADTLIFYAHAIPEVDLPFHIWGAR